MDKGDCIAIFFSYLCTVFNVEFEVGKFDAYIIPLKSLSAGNHTFEYLLGNDYFTKIDSPEVQKGDIKAHVFVKKSGNTFEITFNLEGNAIVACDRCLDDMEQSISCKEKICVKFGKDFSDEDEVVIVPEDEGEINIAWFLYEFIVLSIPIKHVHAPGKCNKSMSMKLRKHKARNIDDDEEVGLDENEDLTDNEEGGNDPRWDKLKEIFDND
jgi:uncharacterized metal-binding protein YceD (DUF177 family)